MQQGANLKDFSFYTLFTYGIPSCQHAHVSDLILV